MNQPMPSSNVHHQSHFSVGDENARVLRPSNKVCGALEVTYSQLFALQMADLEKRLAGEEAAPMNAEEKKYYQAALESLPEPERTHFASDTEGVGSTGTVVKIFSSAEF
eukprot:1417937-Rhodomonas_salina.1